MRVVVFSAQWCGQCKAYHPTIESVCKDKGIELLDVDADSEVQSDIDLMEKYKVRSLPTTVIEKDNGEHKILYGIKTKSQIEEVL